MGRTIFQHILEQNGIPKLRERIADIDRHRREKRGKRTKKRGKTNLMHYRDRNTSVHPAPHKLLEKIEKERAVSLFLSCRLPLLFDYPDCSYQNSRCKNATWTSKYVSLLLRRQIPPPLSRDSAPCVHDCFSVEFWVTPVIFIFFFKKKNKKEEIEENDLRQW